MNGKTSVSLVMLIVRTALFLPYLGVQAQENPAGVPGDTTSAAYWRQKGYEARMRGDMDESLKNYQRVLSLDPADWDANLAVARMLFAGKKYQESMVHYLRVHEYDSANTEALYGLGRCSYRSGRFREAEQWYRKTLEYLPGHFPLLEDLSYALVNSGQTPAALEVYRKMAVADPASAMAWAGIGRILLADGKPAAARKHLKKAMDLEPDNKESADLLRQADHQMAGVAGYQFMYINENEPIDLGSDTAAYNIDALVNILSFHKRLSDRLTVRFSHLLDRSEREYFQQNDTMRWFDNTSLRATLALGDHRISGYLGVSLVENRMTSYGIAWESTKRIGKIRMDNTLMAGYDYYYYWNQVGHDVVSDNLKITLSRFVLDASYRYVNVRELYLIDIESTGRNPGHQYSITGKYSFFRNPKITAGIYHQYRDYRYRSSRYWSPQDRKLNGVLLSIYWESAHGFTASATGNTGKDSYDITHWEASGEIGYNRKNMSYTVGASRFYNPWYENLIAYFSVTRRLTGK